MNTNVTDATEEEMEAVRAFQVLKGKLTSFAAFFGAGVEYGEGVQRKKDAKMIARLFREQENE